VLADDDSGKVIGISYWESEDFHDEPRKVRPAAE
jgi:hypothetical protein